MQRTMEKLSIYGPDVKKTLAHEENLRRDKLCCNLRKAESSLAIQLRTEKVGIAKFLYTRRVPGVVSLACNCGRRQENLVTLRLNRARHRSRLYEAVGTDQYEKMMSTRKVLRALSEDLLG